MTFRSSKAKLRLQTATAITGALLATGVASPAFAQSAPDQEIEEAEENVILVIARKQEETLQDVPVAVTVLSAETLDNFRIETLEGIVSMSGFLNDVLKRHDVHIEANPGLVDHQ